MESVLREGVLREGVIFHTGNAMRGQRCMAPRAWLGLGICCLGGTGLSIFRVSRVPTQAAVTSAKRRRSSPGPGLAAFAYVPAPILRWLVLRQQLSHKLDRSQFEADDSRLSWL
uniref:Uncharacterized protein n=1 Tax=Anopheles melas TaxID=34690 RepID=A0A182TDY6_9DIPT